MHSVLILTWLQQIELLLQLGHFCVVHLLLFALDVLLGEHFQIDHGHFCIFAVELVQLLRRVELRPRAIVRKLVRLASLLGLGLGRLLLHVAIFGSFDSYKKTPILDDVGSYASSGE